MKCPKCGYSSEELWSRYSRHQRIIIEEFLRCVARTRKSGRISESVRGQILARLGEFPPEVVEEALLTYINRKYFLRFKDERYAYGICRRVRREHKLRQLRRR